MTDVDRILAQIGVDLNPAATDGAAWITLTHWRERVTAVLEAQRALADASSSELADELHEAVEDMVSAAAVDPTRIDSPDFVAARTRFHVHLATLRAALASQSPAPVNAAHAILDELVAAASSPSRSGRDAALEEAARECEGIANELLIESKQHESRNYQDSARNAWQQRVGALRCCEQIRSLQSSSAPEKARTATEEET